MSENKKFCSVHHFYYLGNECPFCIQDRVYKLEKEHCHKEDKPIREDRGINSEDLDKLINKFNVR